MIFEQDVLFGAFHIFCLDHKSELVNSPWTSQGLSLEQSEPTESY